MTPVLNLRIIPFTDLIQPLSALKEKRYPTICGLNARIECEPLSERSTHSNKVTNIGYLLSFKVSATY